MATKQQAIDFMKSKYTVEDLGDDMFKMLFNLQNGRSQLIFASFNDSWIQFSSKFASVDELTPKQALEASSDWICGIQLIGEGYFVRNVVSLKDLDESDFVENLELVMNVADSIEEKSVGGDNW